LKNVQNETTGKFLVPLNFSLTQNSILVPKCLVPVVGIKPIMLSWAFWNRSS